MTAAGPHSSHDGRSGADLGRGSGTFDILCFAGNDWWAHNPLPEQRWMRLYGASGHRVLYVNSIGIGMPALSSPALGRRILAKLGSLARWLRRGAPGVWVLTPLLLPLWSSPAVRRVNRVLLAAQLRLVLAALRMRGPLLWAGLPTAAAVLDLVPHCGVLYYVQDHFTAYFDEMTFSRVHDDHEHMIAAADVLVVAGIALGEQLRARHRDVRIIPHGVDAAFFRAAGQPPPPPGALRALPRPVIGYWGSLDAVQDGALIEALARARPEWSFVYIGRPRIDLRRFAAYPNIHFPGYVEPAELPAWGAAMDAAIMSFVQNEWILFSCPVKYREYLALGLPVVAPRIHEVERAFPGAARCASSHEEFIRALDEEVAADTPARRSARRALVEGWTWEHTAALVLDAARRARREEA